VLECSKIRGFKSFLYSLKPCAGKAKDREKLTGYFFIFLFWSCVLALYVGIGTIFRKFENLRIFETTREDLVFDDFFVTFFANGQKKIKVISET
jgi:hypothetical protein